MTTTRKIKFVANAVRWFDRTNGNTYHSVRITRCSDGKVIVCPFEYGYGDQYKATALVEMCKAKMLPVKYRGEGQYWRFERENGYPIEWNVVDGLKRDCIANGTI